MRIIGLVGSPEAGGRTSTAVAAVLAGAADVDTELIELSVASTDHVVQAMADADAVVFGSPVYRATYSALLKATLEATERGKWGEKSAPLQGKVAATVLTGASPHHFLAMNDLRNVLAGFFAVQVLSPGLYVDHSSYADRSTLKDDALSNAACNGAALAALARAVGPSAAVYGLRPQI
jgi:FMN reductase